MDGGVPDVARLVREVLDEARRAVGSGPAFAEELRNLGVGPATGLYSQSAVSNWINGRTMPPADVLIAAAHIAGISLDERVHAGSRGSGDRGPAGGDELQRQIDALQAQMFEVYGRLGMPWPITESSRFRSDRRGASG